MKIIHLTILILLVANYIHSKTTIHKKTKLNRKKTDKTEKSQKVEKAKTEQPQPEGTMAGGSSQSSTSTSSSSASSSSTSSSSSSMIQSNAQFSSGSTFEFGMQRQGLTDSEFNRENQAVQYGIGFTSTSMFDPIETLQFARQMANAIFIQGQDPMSIRERQNTFDQCFNNLNINIEAAKTFIKRFWEECNKIAKAPLLLWNNRIFESTLLQAFKMYALPVNKTITCDQAILPFAEPFTTPDWSNIPKFFRRIFDGYNNTGDFRLKTKFIKSAVSNRRDRLPNRFFRDLNSESRVPSPGLG